MFCDIKKPSVKDFFLAEKIRQIIVEIISNSAKSAGRTGNGFALLQDVG